MMLKILWPIWPVALLACSSSPAAAPAGGGAAGASSSSSSGNGGMGGTVASIAGASNSGAGDVSASGSGGAAALAGGGAGGSAGAFTVGGAGGSASGSGGAAGAGLGGASGSSNSGSCSGLFCEDFEQGQGQLDPAKWYVQMGAGGIEMVQQDTVAHGKYALHVHGTGAAGDFALIITKNAPKALQGAGPVFGRAYVYAAANFGAHIQLGFAGTTHDPAVAASITTKGMNFNYMEFAEFSGSWQLGFDLFAPDPAIAKGFVEEASYPPAHDKPPAMKWSCIEWEFGDDPELMLLWV
ncbi:MAG TPA: hypothetical protein VHW01_04650, partial [Polyangiaceae bacterium]|nr:hypothetical protein [Polyangiaceae bacterium]